jgi:hypothetical protein
MLVTWTDDLRPMPDEVPAGIAGAVEALAYDKTLIVKRSGEVISSSRSFFSGWVFLVKCDDGELREVEADRCKVLEEVSVKD